MPGVINKIESLRALRDKVLGISINHATMPKLVRNKHIDLDIQNLIIARWVPVRQETSWEKAVSAVSGEDILDDVTSEHTLISLKDSGPSGKSQACMDETHV